MLLVQSVRELGATLHVGLGVGQPRGRGSARAARPQWRGQHQRGGPRAATQPEGEQDPRPVRRAVPRQRTAPGEAWLVFSSTSCNFISP